MTQVREGREVTILEDLDRQDPEASALIRDLLEIGGLLSNTAFNLSQPSGAGLNDRDRTLLRSLYQRWDAALSKVKPLSSPLGSDTDG